MLSMMPTLVRSAEPVPETVAGLEDEVLREAAAQLRYRPGRQHLDAAATRRQGLAILDAAGVVPLRADRVRAYKQARYWRPILWAIVGAMASFLVAVGCGLLVVSPPQSSALLLRLGASLGLITGIVGVVVMIVRAVHYSDFRWRRIGLDDYDEPVPAFALSTALALHQAGAGQVNLSVEALRYVQRPSVDPFLVMRYNGAEFYVEVWDEPSFDARRRV